MKQGQETRLYMKKQLCTDEVLDTKEYLCSVLSYDLNKECIYLVLESETLSDISLDAIYECQIREEQHRTISTGRIRQRYQNQYGDILEFHIENGFYKINIKLVDK